MEDFQHLEEMLKKKVATLDRTKMNQGNSLIYEKDFLSSDGGSSTGFQLLVSENTEKKLQIKHLFPRKGLQLKEVLASIEDSLIREALAICKNNKNKASKILGINRTTLIEKMKKKGISLT